MKMEDVSFEVKASISVPDETANRCLRILEMWWDDHPECDITCESINVGGRLKHKLIIKRWSNDGEEQIPGIRYGNNKQE